MSDAKNTTSQRVIDSCEARWDAWKGDCSGFAKAVATDLGVALFGQANAIIDGVSKNWIACTDGMDAAAKAMAGYFVIAGLKAEPNGHVVVVVAGPLNRGKYPTAYWGRLGSVGKKNTTINWSWQLADLPKVGYWYTPIKPLVLS